MRCKKFLCRTVVCRSGLAASSAALWRSCLARKAARVARYCATSASWATEKPETDILRVGCGRFGVGWTLRWVVRCEVSCVLLW